MSNPTSTGDDGPRPADSHPPPGVDQPQEDEPPDIDLLLAVVGRLLREIEERHRDAADEALRLRVLAVLAVVARLVKHRRGEG